MSFEEKLKQLVSGEVSSFTLVFDCPPKEHKEHVEARILNLVDAMDELVRAHGLSGLKVGDLSESKVPAAPNRVRMVLKLR